MTGPNTTSPTPPRRRDRGSNPIDDAPKTPPTALSRREEKLLLAAVCITLIVGLWMLTLL